MMSCSKQQGATQKGFSLTPGPSPAGRGEETTRGAQSRGEGNTTSEAAKIVTALVSCAIFACSCSHKDGEAAPEPVEVHCVAASWGAVDESVSLRGRVSAPPGGDLPVASQVSGRVVAVLVHEGQHIGAGEIVARVDDVASKDAYLQASATLAQSRAAQVNAQATLDRTRTLVARGIAAKQELDDAVARADAAKAGTAASMAMVDLARRTLGRVDVRSSFAGVVTRIWRGQGALVDGSSATPIVQLATSQQIEFVAESTEREFFALAEGQAARGELSDRAVSFDGTVRARASALDPLTGLAPIRIAVATTTASMPLGAFGRVVITKGHRDKVLQIPLAALRGAVADGAEVAVCKNGKAELRALRTGWRDDKSVEVVGGLGPEERVAVDHVLGLEDGTTLREAQ
jgi:HlyD family secretion protein